MAMELVFKNDIANLPKMLAFNYDELKCALGAYLTKFDGLLVENSPESIKAAEADRAEINKVGTAIKRARIDIKKRAFDAFETRAKELEAMCDKASGAIGEQLKAFDEQRKAKKLELVNAELASQLNEAFGHGDITTSPAWGAWIYANCKRARGAWLNSGVSLDTIAEEIAAEVQRVKSDYETLESFTEADGVAVKTLALDSFFATLNLASAMERVKAYRDEQRRIAEAQAREAAREAAKTPVESVQPVKPCNDTTQPVKAAENAPKLVYRLELEGTREQLKALRAFIDANGITYRKI